MNRLLLILIVLILFCLMLVVIDITKISNFASIAPITTAITTPTIPPLVSTDDHKSIIPETLAERWTRRWKELSSLDVNRYKKYFEKIDLKRAPIIDQPGKIFVAIASYRDSQCPLTVQHLIEMADKPEDVHIMVCQQNGDLDTDCLSWCTFNKANKACKVTTIEKLRYDSARGPTYARARLQYYWSGEEYYMQIDAHMRFVKGWDTLVKDQWSLCNDERAILTNYPCEYEITDNSKNPTREKWVTHKRRGPLYVQRIEPKDGFTRITSDYTDIIKESPFPAAAWAAGFSFSKASFIKDVPYDPYTPFLFFGEELDIAARAYTFGYSFYSPTINILFHNYKRDHRKTFWENPDQKGCEILSRFRIYVKLGLISENDLPPVVKDIILIDLKNYGLGNIRVLQDYEELAKINLKDEKKL